jgi:WD repeat-containing protein 68
MIHAPPLLRLAASPHDAHLLATFAADSNIVRILDVRQPGQALLELRGHSASLNAVEWSPTRRGVLATGGDDALVLVWNIMNPNIGASLNGTDTNNGTTPTGQPVATKGPFSSWPCEFEVGNLSWAPQSRLSTKSEEWLGVSGGKGIWGVQLGGLS